jgi:DnaJ like chaperone protein
MWGKVILGGVGAVLGGPIGAGIGVALGDALFDSPPNPPANSSNLSASSDELSEEEQAGVAYFVCLFASLAKMAKADGQVTKEEIKGIEEIIGGMGLDKESREFAIGIFREAKDDDVSISEYLNQLAEIIHYDAEISSSFFALLCGIASADSDVSDRERAILLEAQSILQLQPGTIDIFVKTRMSLQKAYELLSCDKTMSDSDVKRAYRKKCMDFHPDRLNSYGLPPEFIKFSNEQMTQLHDAYEIICNSRSCEYIA